MEEQDRESLSFFIKQFFLIMFWILYWNSIIGSLYNNIFKKGYTLKYLFLLKHYTRLNLLPPNMINFPNLVTWIGNRENLYWFFWYSQLIFWESNLHTPRISQQIWVKSKNNPRPRKLDQLSIYLCNNVVWSTWLPNYLSWNWF